MMSKNVCRSSLNMQKYVKIGVYADEFGISRSTLSRFMRSSAYNELISTERINSFVEYISFHLSNFT